MSMKAIFRIESFLLYFLVAFLPYFVYVVPRIPVILAAYFVFPLEGLCGVLAFKYPIDEVYRMISKIFSDKGGGGDSH